jgi:hypothetical protein
MWQPSDCLRTASKKFPARRFCTLTACRTCAPFAIRYFASMAVACLFLVPTCFAQNPQPLPQQQPAQVQQPAPATPSQQTITVPSGTTVALALENPIQTKLAKHGDAIRAATLFPVTVGTEVAIPAGTYVEGTLDKVIKNGLGGHPELKVHFTRMLFSNGYDVPLEGAVSTASAEHADRDPSALSAVGSQTIPANALAFQQPPPPPQLTPPPAPGPSKGLVIGISVGVAVATAVGAILWSRHRRGDVLLDAGWQFQMVLQHPLTLDEQKVAAALAASDAQ